jgi:hypothetical protein
MQVLIFHLPDDARSKWARANEGSGRGAVNPFKLLGGKGNQIGQLWRGDFVR